LSELEEKRVSGFHLWSTFLHRRIAPAMRTCRSVQDRLTALTDKVSGSSSLLSSWIDVQLEHQNSGLLATMNDRAKLQLQMQQTVEVLSVASISYYIVGLLGYMVNGITVLHDIMAPELTIVIMLPFVVLAVWWMVRRIRLSHSENGQSH